MSDLEWKPQVYLVGAGPGDPGLLTRRGEAVLRKADIVLYDALSHPSLLDLAPAGAERVYVGKRAGQERPGQDAISERMIEEARAGKIVVRLKGGDSFVFGRGGEEAEALLEADIEFEVVPGVSSLAAVPASAGIPLTHRAFSSAVHVITGHEDPADRESRVPWDLLTQTGHTVVVLMGSARLIGILERLKASGMAGDTPVAAIHQGTLPTQRSVRGTLDEALAEPERFKLGSPALAVIGAVAGVDSRLNWFERRPLFGRRFILTRPAERGAGVSETLMELGADVVSCPAIRFDSEVDISAPLLRERLIHLGEVGGWLILPSPTAVNTFIQSLEILKVDARILGNAKIATIGRASAAESKRFGLRPDFLPSRPTAADLARELPLPSKSPTVLVAGAAQPRPELREGLTRRGARVIHHILYTTLPDEEGLRRFREAIAGPSVDGVIIFSPSAVEAICENFDEPDSESVAGAPSSNTRPTLAGLQWFAVGETTAEAAEKAGLPVAGIAEDATPESLAATLIQSLRQKATA